MPQAKAADGTSLYYESQGSGPAIVFVHELAGTCHSFDLQVAALKSSYRCITFNARGYPPSDVPGAIESYSQDIAAEDIGAVLDAAGEKDAHVMGVSMGSAAALQFTIAHPGRVRSRRSMRISTRSRRCACRRWSCSAASIRGARSPATSSPKPCPARGSKSCPTPVTA
jgi:pimeloyl-ACP methyl ester carboxylesterase